MNNDEIAINNGYSEIREFELEQYSKGKTIKFEIVKSRTRDFDNICDLILPETDLYVIRDERGFQV